MSQIVYSCLFFYLFNSLTVQIALQFCYLHLQCQIFQLIPFQLSIELYKLPTKIFLFNIPRTASIGAPQRLTFIICQETACILISILFIHQMLSTQLPSTQLLIRLIPPQYLLIYTIFIILVITLLLIYIFISQCQKKSFYFLTDASLHHDAVEYLMLECPQANFQGLLRDLAGINQFVLKMIGKYRLHYLWL